MFRAKETAQSDGKPSISKAADERVRRRWRRRRRYSGALAGAGSSVRTGWF